MDTLPVFITVKQVMRITGKKERTCQRLLNQIHNAYGRRKIMQVTVDEFCEYMGLRYKDIEEYLPEPDELTLIKV